ncbi:MAG TPA: SOS response-associated peptidase [Steroidobacteraceae bacterium]|jgi:putative SOS response-associated peptidase YedK
MCDRYVIPDQVAAEREFLPAQVWWKFEPHFNVAARRYVPAIRVHDAQTEGMMMRWGLIPAETKGKPSGSSRACADIERVERSKTYKMPWLNGQRCILPAAGFFVWKLTPANYRQPYYVRVNNRSVFGFAAVWDRWSGEDEDVIESCSIIRVPANSLLADVADSDRMPAVLKRRDYDTWLRGTPVEARAALQSYNPEWMTAYAVSPRINSQEPDDAGLIQPIDA